MSDGLWTLDQLAELVDAALSVDYPGQASGRVRDVPDRRVIRYYTTLGLVDRPAGSRGRIALYGRRHLLQLVAIKRMQAQGLSLARVQRRLAGATNDQLEQVASLPDPLPSTVAAGVGQDADQAAASLPFRAADPSPEPAGSPWLPGGPPHQPTPDDFWKRPPVPAADPGPADLAAAVEGGADWGEAPRAAVIPAARRDTVTTLQGVWLGEGVTLLLDLGRPLHDADVRAIEAAARPLLATLRARGLGGRPGGGREHS